MCSLEAKTMSYREIAERFMIEALYYSGLFRLFDSQLGGVGSILTFHRVMPSATLLEFAPNRSLTVTPEYFEQVIRLLIQRGLEIVTLDEAKKRMAHPGTSKRFACLTFDDGYLDNFRFAYPVCRRLGVPMTVYMTTGFIDRIATPWWELLAIILRERSELTFDDNGVTRSVSCVSAREKSNAFGLMRDLLIDLKWADRERIVHEICGQPYGDLREQVFADFMTWENAREMSKSGLVEIGCHTVSHSRLRCLDSSEARYEIMESCKRIEVEVERPARHLAYPFGGPIDVSLREFDLCRSLELETGVTMTHGNLLPQHHHYPLAWPRLPISGLRQTRAAAEVTVSGALGAAKRLATVFVGQSVTY